jgi:putative aldouronate transport system permease protein
MALAIISAGPMLFIMPFFQKYFVRGLTIGSIKG